MTLTYHISQSSVTEDCTAYVYEPQLDGSLSLVAQQAVPAPHTSAATLLFTGLDRITFVLQLKGDDSGFIYHNFSDTPTTDDVTVFDFIQFRIGDGGLNTPLAGTASYLNTLLAGKNLTDYTIYKNGTGFLFDAIHVTNNIAGGFDLMSNTFDANQLFTIKLKDEVIKTPVNDSVVGKEFGPTVLRADMFVDVNSTVDYDPSHLRKLIRLSGHNAVFRFTNTSVPPAGYTFTITNFGGYASLSPQPKVQFQNASLKYGNTTLTEVSIPLGQIFKCVFDGTIWNAVSSLPYQTSIVPTFASGTTAVGDIPVDKIVTINIGTDMGTISYFATVVVISNGNTSFDNDLGSPAIIESTKTNSTFQVAIGEYASSVQNIKLSWLVIKF